MELTGRSVEEDEEDDKKNGVTGRRRHGARSREGRQDARKCGLELRSERR